MENTFTRDPNSNALINNDISGYNARKMAKLRAKKQKNQEEEIKFLKQELNELKALINKLTIR